MLLYFTYIDTDSPNVFKIPCTILLVSTSKKISDFKFHNENYRDSLSSASFQIPS